MSSVQEQYRCGINKIWKALGINSAQKEDVFTLAAQAIEDAKSNFFKNKYCRVAARLKNALGICGPQDVDIFTQAVNAIRDAKTLKPFRIKVIQTDGTSGVRLIHAFNETDARAIAYYGAKGTIDLGDLKVANQWTVVLPEESAEEKLAKLKSEHAALRERVAMVKSHLARLLRCQRMHGSLEKVLISVCRCGRYTVDEYYPHRVVERIEVKTIQEAREIYLNTFNTLKEFNFNTTLDRCPDKHDFNFIILNGIFLCQEHSCPK